VQLQADHAAAGELLVGVVGAEVPVDPDPHPGADRLDHVVVPLAGLDELLAAVFGEQAAAALLVQLAPPAGPDVGLRAAHLAVGQWHAAELDAAVLRVRRQLHLQRQPEVLHRQLRHQEVVPLQPRGRLADNLAVLDRPERPVAVPVRQILAVEEVLGVLSRGQHRHLGRGLQVGDERAEFVLVHLLQDVVGHHREFRRLAAGNIGGGDGQKLAVGLHGQHAVGLALDDADDAAVVGGDDPRGGVLLRDDGTGVEDVFQQVVDAAAVGPGDLGADLAADAVERVAVLARLREDGAAQVHVAGRGHRGGEPFLPRGDQLLPFLGRLADGAPQVGDLLVERGVLEGPELADHLGGNVGRGNLLGRDGVHEFLGEAGAGRQGGDGVPLLGRGEVGIGGEEDGRRPRVVEGGQGADRCTA